MKSTSPHPDYESLRKARAAQPVQRTMMRVPLRITDVMRRAEHLFAEQEVISRHGPGRILRFTYAQIGDRARRLAGALQARGVQPGMRVATLMWNHAAHLAAYYAVPGIHAVLHTLNPRLSAEELAYIVADAGDAAILVDDDLLPLLQEIERHVQIPLVIVHALGDKPSDAAVQSGYPLLDEVLACSPGIGAWHEDAIDENTPISICYTSGTTGRPKGVVYSHRSVLLHALAVATPDAFAISGRDTVMTLTPMFHVNAWSMPYTALMLGARLVLTGPRPAPDEVADLMAQEEVTAALGVPTLWEAFLGAVEQQPGRWRFAAGARIYSGGAAPPAEMFRRFDKLGLYLQTGWGMTETSPMGSQTWIKKTLDAQLDAPARLDLRTGNGLPLPFVEMRHVDDTGQVQARDGQAIGELQVRGPWVTSAYIGHPEPTCATSADGWLLTGDIVQFQPTGYMRLVDRKKDLIKSGGEWISSTGMESALYDHPAVAEAAVIAVPDAHWGERPLAVVALKFAQQVTAEDIKSHLLARFPKWMVPEQVVFMDSLPKTGVGKLNKLELRRSFA
ncbi:MAG: long-chain-fatty-acid--CoA ligase [Burkholderiaceae bacterium]|nr:long-chain-fatty-acid--CoA ligase [Burkholderiaceae bacterium]